MEDMKMDNNTVVLASGPLLLGYFAGHYGSRMSTNQRCCL